MLTMLTMLAMLTMLTVLTTLTTLTRLVLTQKLLTNLKFPALEGLYYMVCHALSLPVTC